MTRIKKQGHLDLKIGDVIRNKGTLNTYVVTGVYKDRAIAVRTVNVANFEEWER